MYNCRQYKKLCTGNVPMEKKTEIKLKTIVKQNALTEFIEAKHFKLRSLHQESLAMVGSA